MVYPPSVPPSDRTDSTVAAGKHATDHNQLATALAALIVELGPAPAGSYVDVTARLSDLLGKTEASTTYVRFEDQDGAPLTGRHVVIKVDSTTGDVLDILAEA